jgi:signal transduction histidine kinase
MTGKNKTILLAIAAIILAIYNVIVFSLFSPGFPAFWPTWAFTTLAVILSGGVVAYCAGAKSATLRDVFLSWPLVYVSCGYGAIQIALSFAALALPNFTATAANLSQAALLAAYLVMAASAMLGRNVVDAVDAKQSDTTLFVKNLAADTERLAARVKDGRAKIRLQKLHETARYSDPVSHPSLAPLEREIMDKFGELSSLTNEKDIPLREGIDILCDEITSLIGDRNGKCKFLKQGRE